jgi:mannan endo-1,4-beta-mannosidase
MFKKLRRTLGITLILLILVGQFSSAAGAAAAQNHGFVQRTGNILRWNGKQFRFAGSSNYYLMYKSQFMVDDVLEAAAGNGFRVMRIWGSLDIGDPNDPSTSLRGPADGVYFQYWDPTAGAPAYNDGSNGLERLDYVIYKAGQEGLRLVIPFVNNWNDFGGMDQYVRWRDLSTPDDQTWYHDSFYTDPVIQQWYRDWIAHLLNRVNIYNGIAYKDDPTIMTWELGNEPRCLSAGAYGRSPDCTTQTLIEWADEMSTYIKSIDSNHLVSVGDEGFYCLPNPTHWTENCGEGVDTVAFTRLPNIDVMSVHLYPDSWGTDVAWGTEWIKQHIRDAKANGKPVMLGEFGIRDQSIRNKVYKEWTDAAFKSGGQSGADGALYWILSGRQDDGSLYPDYDGFTVYAGTPVFITLGHFAEMMTLNRRLTFPPVADHDTAVTEFNTPVTLDPPANDITYGGATLKVNSLDLDPAAGGQQTSVSVAGGSFVASANGTVLFTPADGFVGPVQASYVIKDSSARLSNAAQLRVTVKPDPGAALLLASYETGTNGAAPIGGAGTISQSSAFATDGASSLEITVTGEGWFRVADLSAAPANVSQKISIRLDLQTLDNQTYRKLSIQVGDSWSWCEQSGGDGNTPQNTVATISLDLTNMTCSGADLTKLQAVNIYLQPGTYRIDYVRAE